jgi:hypothetical protein
MPCGWNLETASPESLGLGLPEAGGLDRCQNDHMSRIRRERAKLPVLPAVEWRG